MRCFFLVLMLGLAFTCGPEAAVAAPKWDTPDQAAKLGFIALQCDQRDICFAVACPGGKAQLVSVSPGGGPFEGDATLAVGEQRYSLSFVWDDAIIDVMGSAGARASLAPQALAALRRQNATIVGNNTGPSNATIYSAGLDRFWDAIVEACDGALAAPPQ